MSNAILLNWLNFSNAISAMPKNEQPVSSEQLKNIFSDLLLWYQEFTDIPSEVLETAATMHEQSIEASALIKKKGGLHSSVHGAVEFLRAYQQPAEIVNMSRYGAEKQENSDLSLMITKLSSFHTQQMQSLSWLIDWLEKVDPLFPAYTYRNKLACCFSSVEHKFCFDNARKCIFEPSLSWIHVPGATLSGSSSKGDCCLGTTLSSCSGGTLSCDCVAGNTGCDCKAPNQLCGQNDKSVSVYAASFSDVNCKKLQHDLAETGQIMPPCLALDPVRESGCMLEHSEMYFKGSSCTTLNSRKGRFMVSASVVPFNLGRLVMQTKECQQTGFCPPVSSGCSGLC
ncbi:hypothetical protein G9409_06835 [Chlorobium sp. BLA1]|uniref:hypothetical protein n=1 Tax=Candidatus Chlorobium masyuteum TaxID=2716876 RepID=UPI001420445E|nr:hypothetical protein [Candidatus Chlorobium masyuteum]NHQ60307.1 hypothetical protein [Candidatus Chlorobium masyuteum]NTV93006.1 hypothetical protein [Chlorobiaceae bacterium]